jgi:hypothetical protein
MRCFLSSGLLIFAHSDAPGVSLRPAARRGWGLSVERPPFLGAVYISLGRSGLGFRTITGSGSAGARSARTRILGASLRSRVLDA